MRTSGTLTAGLVASLGLFGGASAAVVDARQSCPAIHVFGARETTVSPGYGSAAGLVNAIRSAFPGATSEAITYPACGGQASCGNIAYGDSVRAGTQAVATAVNSFNQRCPDTKIVVVGYSQGGQIFDNAYCGGTDPGAGISTTASPLTASARAAIKAAILFGNPRYRAGLPYNVGTCTAQGFAPREQGFTCQGGDKIKNYCDSPDPYCCNGNNQAVHQGYQGVYGQQALAFVTAQLNAGGGSTPSPPTTPPTTPPTPPTTTPPGGACAAQWAQCGGNGFTGPTCCQAPATCRVVNAWYHQCLS